jgi:hypothetical protein
MKITIERITPKIAPEMLKKNTRNRPHNKHHTRVLTKELTEKRWIQNGDAIRFAIDENGHDILLDGQHRLYAVVASGIAITSVVIRELEFRAFATIDINTRRTTAQMLAIQGRKNTTGLASAAPLIASYYAGVVEGGRRYTATQILELIDVYEGLEHSIKVAQRNTCLLSKRIGGACHYLFTEKEPAAADLFFDYFQKGVGLSKDSPIYLLRELLIRSTSKRSKLSYSYLMAVTIKAWNAYITGRKLRKLRYSPGSEQFPKVLSAQGES